MWPLIKVHCGYLTLWISLLNVWLICWPVALHQRVLQAEFLNFFPLTLPLFLTIPLGIYATPKQPSLTQQQSYSLAFGFLCHYRTTPYLYRASLWSDGSRDDLSWSSTAWDYRGNFASLILYFGVKKPTILAYRYKPYLLLSVLLEIKNQIF